MTAKVDVELLSINKIGKWNLYSNFIIGDPTYKKNQYEIIMNSIVSMDGQYPVMLSSIQEVIYLPECLFRVHLEIVVRSILVTLYINLYLLVM